MTIPLSSPDITEAEIEAMLRIDLLAPILLTRAALPSLRASGDAMVVNITSGIALVGEPFYATYAAAKAGLGGHDTCLRKRTLHRYPLGVADERPHNLTFA